MGKNNKSTGFGQTTGKKIMKRLRSGIWVAVSAVGLIGGGLVVKDSFFLTEGRPDGVEVQDREEIVRDKDEVEEENKEDKLKVGNTKKATSVGNGRYDNYENVSKTTGVGIIGVMHYIVEL